jgi:CheY-like chemotaxis protein
VVSAVWNGKEALDYLVAADSPNPPHHKADIILMDVQMPIIDGYKATHLIRRHAPYNVSSQNIPIVAMTASAIQGDREKCKKAGMDDYLAKPVKSRTLEKMLVRWAINRRIPRTTGEHEFDESDCSEPGEHNCGTAAIPMFGQGRRKHSNLTVQEEPVLQDSRPTMTERQNSHRLTLPGTESEGDRVERREEAEEKATALRDEKLVEAAGASGDRLLTHVEERRTNTPKLTMENVGRLEREIKSRSPKTEFELKKRSSSLTGDSVGVEPGTDPETRDRDKKGGERPRLGRRVWDSERTITGL